MTGSSPTRRWFAGLLPVVLSLLAAPRLAAQEPPPADRGIGGTGVAPPTEGEDHGIGGTGVVGTIRGFGSIVVNAMRIGYAPDVVVTIDGRVARPADLRLGHVVRAAARTADDRLVTRAIAVVSEVIGPVQRQRGRRLTVLGQTVDMADLPDRRWRRGTRVAVSGLRRPDGVIVASRVEPTRETLDRVAGPLERGRGGAFRIGRLMLRRIDPDLVGQRIMVAGRRRGGSLDGARAEREADALRALRSARLSLEVFLERNGGRLSLGSGLAVASAVATDAFPEGATLRAVVSATVRGGQVVVDHIDVVDRDGHSRSGMGGGAGSPEPKPLGAGPAPSGGVAHGPGVRAPGAPPRGGGPVR